LPSGYDGYASSDKTIVTTGSSALRGEKNIDAISRQVMQADRSLPFGDIFGRAARDLLYGAKPAKKSGNERDELRKENSSLFGTLLTR